MENLNASDFGLKICVGEGQQTVIGYDDEEENLYVDRRNSGLDDFTQLFPQLNKGPLKKRDSHLKLHIYVDNCSVEVFANDGETVISSKIYPDPSSLGIELFSYHGKVKVNTIDVWELKKVDLGF